MEDQEVMDQLLANRQNYMIENISADAGCGGLGANEVVGNSGDILGVKYDEQLHEVHDTGDDDESKYVKEVQQSEKSQPQENSSYEYNLNELAEEEVDTAKSKTGNIVADEFEKFNTDSLDFHGGNNHVNANANNDNHDEVILQSERDEVDVEDPLDSPLHKETNANFGHAILPIAITNLDFESNAGDKVAIHLDSMSSQLNPDAEEFVPNFEPKTEGVPDSVVDDQSVLPSENVDVEHVPSAVPRHMVIEDDFVAQSPRKGRADNLDSMPLPAEQEFDQEADQRPHELEADSADYKGDANNEHTLLSYVDSNEFDIKQDNSLNDMKSLISSGNGPETCVDTQDNVGNNNVAEEYVNNELANDVMKQSIYVGSGDPIEDVLNSVQLIPSEVESENNSFSEEIVHPSPLGDKELLQVEEKEDISKSPSTEEIQVNIENSDQSGDMQLLEKKLEVVNISNLKDEEACNEIKHYHEGSEQESLIIATPNENTTNTFSDFLMTEAQHNVDHSVDPIVNTSVSIFPNTEISIQNLQNCDVTSSANSMVNPIIDNKTDDLNIANVEKEMSEPSNISIFGTTPTDAETFVSDEKLILEQIENVQAVSENISETVSFEENLLVEQTREPLSPPEDTAEYLVGGPSIAEVATAEKESIAAKEPEVLQSYASENETLQHQNNDEQLSSVEAALVESKSTDCSPVPAMMPVSEDCASDIPPEGNAKIGDTQTYLKENGNENFLDLNTPLLNLSDKVADLSVASTDESSKYNVKMAESPKIDHGPQDNLMENLSTQGLTEKTKLECVDPNKTAKNDIKNASDYKSSSKDLKSMSPKLAPGKATAMPMKSVRGPALTEKKQVKPSSATSATGKPISHSTISVRSQSNAPSNPTNRSAIMASSKTSTVKTTSSRTPAGAGLSARKTAATSNNCIKQKLAAPTAAAKPLSSGTANALSASKPKVASPRSTPLVPSVSKVTGSGTIAANSAKPKAVSPRTTLSSQLRKAAVPAAPSVKSTTTKPACSSSSTKPTLSSTTGRPKPPATTAGAGPNTTKPFTARPAPKFTSSATPTSRRATVGSSNGSTTATSAAKSTILSARKSSPIKPPLAKTTTKTATTATNMTPASAKPNIKPLAKKPATSKIDASKKLNNNPKAKDVGANSELISNGALAEPHPEDDDPEMLSTPKETNDRDQDDLRNSDSEHININTIGA